MGDRGSPAGVTPQAIDGSLPPDDTATTKPRPRLRRTGRGTEKRGGPPETKRPADKPAASVFGEPLERIGDETRQRLEVVTALEHRADPRSERCRAASELAEPVIGQRHVGRQRIVAMGVEPGR